ncbi:MAG: hypothetical protein RIM99_12560 [Cyclobacteriaceae bacterium]
MRSLVFILLIKSALEVGAQASVKGGELNINTSRLSSIESIPLKDEPGRDGKIYLVDEIHAGTIWFGRIKLDDHLFRYDISNDLFEIEVDGTKKYLNAYGVKHFEILNEDSTIRKFKRVGELEETKGVFNGYFEIIHEAEIDLLGYHYNVLLPSNYIHGLDVGNRAETSVLKTKYFLRNANNEFFEIRRKKDLLKQFSSLSSEIDRYIRKNKPDLKKRDDLKSLTIYMNTLNL